MTDIDQYVSDLTAHEGMTTYPYLDTVGRVTAGIGEMFASVWEFHRTVWYVGSEIASPEQVNAAWDSLQAAKPALRASAYEGLTDLRLSDPGRRCADLLTNVYLPGLLLDLPDLDSRPLGCRRVLVDLAWNNGPRVLQKFPHLLYWLVAGDYRAAAAECHDRGEAKSRGEWRTNQMLSCAEQDMA